MPRITVASLAARIATLEAENATLKATATPSEASAHYVAADLPCTFAKPCERTFRTVKGQTWHRDNMVKAHKA